MRIALVSRLVRKVARKWIGPLLVLLVLVCSLWLLHRELQQTDLRDFKAGLSQIPPRSLWIAVGLTILNYVILIGYDVLGVTYLGHPLQLSKVALGSFLGYAVGNNFGTVLGGSTVRYRLYSTWGLSALDIVKLILILGVTFWIGLFALAGVLFVWHPLEVPPNLQLGFTSTRPLGFLLLTVAGAYLLLCALRHRPIRLGSWEFTPPPLGLSLLQYVVTTFDLVVASGVLYVLLPESTQVGYLHFLGAYLLAIVASLVSQVPGGLGVLELVIVVFLKPDEPGQLMASLLAFRAIYYLFPLVVGLILLGLHELSMHGKAAQKAIGSLGGLMTAFGPRILGFAVYGAGVLLLMSGATPAKPSRMAWLSEHVPLAVVEMAHLTTCVLGMALLILGRNLQRRLASAYYITAIALGVSAITCFVKGLDYPEAIGVALILIVFLPSGASYYRTDVVSIDRFNVRWFLTSLVVMSAVTWLMLFDYRRLDYQTSWWWTFSFDGDAYRSLRGIGAAAVAGILAVGLRLRHPAVKLGVAPTEAERAAAHRIASRSPTTMSHLALLGDKCLLFNRLGTAFVMYGVERRSCIALGDPVGDPQAALGLAWDFAELADVSGLRPVFYQVDRARSSVYVEMGLSLIRIGQEARVSLSSFTLDGGNRKHLRRTHRQLADQGYHFQLLEGREVPACLDQLQTINDAWLQERDVEEKGFAVGFFDPEYLARGPVAVVYHNDRMVAFANLWLGCDHGEISVDLMRYLPSTPDEIMEWLFIELMCWGKAHKYHWLSLGMAPETELDNQPQGALWHHLASIAGRHSDHFYDERELRQYKSRFDPVWVPKYLASTGGLALAAILRDVATLISGGLRRFSRDPSASPKR